MFNTRKWSLFLVLAMLLSLCSGLSASAEDLDILNDPDFDLAGGLPIVKNPEKMPEISILFREFPDAVTPIDESVQVQRYEREAGVKFNWIKVPTQGYAEKLNLMLSSGDLPDMIWTPVEDAIVSQYIGQDVFIPTGDLIEKYVPNLKSIFDEFPNYKAITTATDGNIYGFPYIVQMRGLILSPGPTMINKNWLDKVGLDVPTTVDEYHAALKAFRDYGDLNGNGIGDEFPYAGTFDRPGDFGSMKTINIFSGAFGRANSAQGNVRDNLGVVDGKVMYTAADPAYKETVKYFRTLQEEGLIDPDSFSNDYKTWTDKLRQSEAVLGSFGVWSPEILISDPSVRKQYVVLPRLSGPGGNSGFALNSSEVQNKCHLAITTACKYPELLAAFVNYLYSPEISITSIWGAEGDGWMYHKDENGMLCFNVDENNDIILTNGMENFWSIRCNSGPVEGGAVLDKYYGTVCEYAWDAVTLLDGQIKAGSQEILKEYAVIPDTYLSKDDAARAAQLTTELNNVLNSYTMRWVLDGGVDETWDQYLAELKAAGMDELTALYQRIYDSMNQAA